MGTTDFLDAEQFFSNKEGEINRQSLAMGHLRSLAKYMSVEWHGGYWETRVQQVGNTVFQDKHYNQNSREVFCNAVEYLDCILAPYYEDDEKTKKEIDRLRKKEKELFIQWTNEIQKKYVDENGEEKTLTHRSFTEEEDKKRHSQEQLKLYIQLFRKLNQWLVENNDLDIPPIEE